MKDTIIQAKYMLMCSLVSTKENDIEIKDLRWCAAYHHERGHPHIHIVFWDSSNRVRQEHMGEERFAVATEKIRAAFNREIFKEELRALRGEQDVAKKKLRALSKNQVEGFEGLSFFEQDNESPEQRPALFYPKYLKQDAAETLADRLEQLLYTLPVKGQLAYKYIAPETKVVLDEVSRLVLEQPEISPPYNDFMNAVKGISRAYGNSDESIQHQLVKAHRQVLADVGNDVLATVKSLGWLKQKQEGRLEQLQNEMHISLLHRADAVLTEKFKEPGFCSAMAETVVLLPSFYTPKREVLRDEEVAGKLREMVSVCLSDNELRKHTQISQAFTNCSSKRDPSETEKDQTSDYKTEASEFKAVFRHISNKIYEQITMEKGWPAQAQRAMATNFLLAFCRLTSSRTPLHHGLLNRFRRELSRQAKKERYLKQKDASELWEAVQL